MRTDAYDRHLAWLRSTPVRLICNDCEEETAGAEVSEYGASWFDPYDACPNCGTAWTVREDDDDGV